MYGTGQGVPRDDAEAIQWHRMAADQGSTEAQFSLGYIYANGRGVPQDYVEAAKWFRRAADRGDANAQISLGFMYANGQGVSRDFAEAANWYRRAAERGTPPPSTTWASPTTPAKGCRGTWSRRTSGTTSPEPGFRHRPSRIERKQSGAGIWLPPK